MTPDEQVKNLILHIAQELVDKPEAVKVNLLVGADTTLIELQADKTDTGKLIGKQGRTIDALRTLLSTCTMKYGRRYKLDVLE